MLASVDAAANVDRRDEPSSLELADEVGGV